MTREEGGRGILGTQEEEINGDMIILKRFLKATKGTFTPPTSPPPPPLPPPPSGSALGSQGSWQRFGNSAQINFNKISMCLLEEQ